MSQSAEDALKALKAKIENSIEETKAIIRYAVGKEHYAAAHELSIKVDERSEIVYTINDMLDEFEKVEKHTHQWKYRKDFQYYYCNGCDIALYPNQVEEYLNKWQEQLDHQEACS